MTQPEHDIGTQTRWPDPMAQMLDAEYPTDPAQYTATAQGIRAADIPGPSPELQATTACDG